MSEFYISIDWEADGPCPGVHSGLQLGAVFYNSDGEEIDSFSANLKPLPGAVQNKDTMDFWADHPEVYKQVTSDQEEPSIAMRRFHDKVKTWTHRLHAAPVIIAYPAGFDFTFLYYYLHRFVGESIVGFAALDIKTYAMAVRNSTFRDSVKRNFPKKWFPKKAVRHIAENDARQQGCVFFNARRALADLHSAAEKNNAYREVAQLDS